MARTTAEARKLTQLEASVQNVTATVVAVEEAIDGMRALALEDRGWEKIGGNVADDLRPDEYQRLAEMCEMMTIANPLIKRGHLLRFGWVWGDGCTIDIDGDAGQDTELTGGIVSGWLADNADQLWSSRAWEQMERMAYTRGALVVMLHTDDVAKTVTPRIIDRTAITDLILDPDDCTRIRYYKRATTTWALKADGTPGAAKKVNVWHPHVDYQPAPADRLESIGRDEVRWDQPILHVSFNAPAAPDKHWGIPDAYAALPWARMSKEYLEAWFALMRALSRYAWQTKTCGSKAQAAAAAATAAQNVAGMNPAGAHAFTDPGTTLEAVPKTGATIDAESGRPLQEMIAAALDVPLAQLIGNASTGANGSRSAQETLDQPTEMAMSARRAMWTTFYVKVLGYVIDTAAEHGRIPGAKVLRVGGRRTVTLPDKVASTVQVTWPPFDSLDITAAMGAVSTADQLDKLPPDFIAESAMKILGQALHVDNLDGYLAKLRDDAGNWIDPKQSDPEAPPVVPDDGQSTP